MEEERDLLTQLFKSEPWPHFIRMLEVNLEQSRERVSQIVRPSDSLERMASEALYTKGIITGVFQSMTALSTRINYLNKELEKKEKGND